MKSYTEIYECDLINDTMNLVLQNKDILSSVKSTGRYRQAYKDYSMRVVHPDDAVLRDRLFDANLLIRRFNDGEKEVIGEYRRLGKDGDYRWVIATVIPAGEWDEHNHKILILIKDITEYRRQQEERKKQEHRAYNLFRQSCDTVAEVDLKTGECTYIVNKGEGAGESPQKGNYAQIL